MIRSTDDFIAFSKTFSVRSFTSRADRTVLKFLKKFLLFQRSVIAIECFHHLGLDGSINNPTLSQFSAKLSGANSSSTRTISGKVKKFCSSDIVRQIWE